MKTIRIKHNIRIYLTIFFSFLMSILISSCSLIKLETGVKPLTKRELNARIATHEFADYFSLVVEHAADSILFKSTDVEVQINALNWKINALAANRKTIFQPSPVAALIDTWVFCTQMNLYFSSGAGKDIFGEWQTFAIEASDSLEKAVLDIVISMTNMQEFNNLKGFVDTFVEKHPFKDISFNRESVNKELRQFWGIPDSVAISTVGSLPESVTEFGSIVSAYSEQIPKQTGWRAQLFAKESGIDSARIREKIDSLSALLNRIVAVAENSPELLDKSFRNLRLQLLPLLDIIDKQRNETLDNLGRERIELTDAFRLERIAITEDFERFATVTIDKSWTNIRAIINRALVALSIFVIIILSVSFFLGFFVGKKLQK